MSKLLLVIFCALAGVAGGAISQYFYYGLEAERIVANEIILIDSETGRMYGKISSNHSDGASGIVLFDKQESPKLGSLVFNGAPMINLYGEDRNIQAALASDAEGANLFFYGGNNRVVSSLGYNSSTKESGLTVGNEEATAASVISFYKSKPFVEVFANNKTIFTTFNGK